MLIQFSLSNWQSFHEKEVLSLRAGRERSLRGHVVAVPGTKDLSVLRVGALYGANAAGKSNLIQALSYLQSLIVDGTRPGGGMRRRPYRLDPEARSQPSRFQLDIVHDGVGYSYGIVIDDTTVVEEWLDAGSPTPVPMFERYLRDGETAIDLKDSLTEATDGGREFLDFVAKGTRSNQPFLTELVERDVDNVRPFYDWVRNVLTIIRPDASYLGLEKLVHSNEGFAEALGRVLREADTGISAVRAERIPYEQAGLSIPEEIIDDLRAELKGEERLVMVPGGMLEFDDAGEARFYRLRTVHPAVDGGEATFGMAEESAGTQRLAHLAPALIGQATPRVYVIDELERSLHPLLCRWFVRAFLNRDPASVPSQLIFVTHDTNLLDSDVLRRDEIWFAEKDEAGASHLTSLSDYRIRGDLNYRKGYLHGRFGAIPFLGDPARLSADDEAPGGA